MPGEWYSPTQPFPTKPPAFDRQGVTLDDLIDFTPELKAEGAEIAAQYKLGPMFTPPVLSKMEGPLGTLMLPAVTGGANWQGGSLDPETKIALHLLEHNISALGMVPPRSGKSRLRLRSGGTRPAPSAAPAAAGGDGRRRWRRWRRG